MLDPEIVLFDEPDSGLDPVRTALLCDLIKEVHEENGGTYVVITHDIASARRTPEYMAILWRGKIVEAGLRQNSSSPRTSSCASSSPASRRGRWAWSRAWRAPVSSSPPRTLSSRRMRAQESGRGRAFARVTSFSARRAPLVVAVAVAVARPASRWR